MSDLLHDVFRPPAGELDSLRLTSPPRAAAPALAGEPGSALKHEVRVNGEKVHSHSPKSTSPEREEREDEGSSEDEEVGVVSGSATPVRLSRPGSPTRLAGASHRRAPGPLLISASKTDPFRRLGTELVIRILVLLSPEDLARCSRVAKKWNTSQAANFVWFRHTRQAALPDSSLPLITSGSAAPTWTKRESKQNWRREYAVHLLRQRADPPPTLPPFSRSSSRPASRAGDRSPGSASGYQTPREVREEQWAREKEGRERPGKVEMREAYKELGGRKARVKGSGGWEKGAARDRTMWGEEES